MARGRFISNSIITDRQVNELSSDTCRLAYTWAITLADCEGRISGEPELLLAQLFPRRLGEFSTDTIEGFIWEWVYSGFVVWYEADDGDRVLQFKNFGKHQIGLRKDREAESDYPPPEDCRIIDGVTPELVRSSSGVDPELLPVNVNDNVKLNDNDNVNLKGESHIKSALFDAEEYQRVWEEETGSMVGNIPDFYEAYEFFLDHGVTPEVFRISIRQQKESDYSVTKPSSVKNWAANLVKQDKKLKDQDQEKSNEQIIKEMIENGEL